MKREKRYFLSVVEEMIMNPKFGGLRAGRIEVHDNKSKSEYAIGEGRFLVPEEIFYPFREMLDFKSFDLPIRIDLNMFEYPDERKKYYGEK